MRLAFALAAPLLAVLAQPALAAESGTTEQLEPAPTSGPLRADYLRRVAETIVLDDARSPQSGQQQADEAVKARTKAEHQSGHHGAPAECSDCPDKTANRPSHSARDARKIDCIDCRDRPATA